MKKMTYTGLLMLLLFSPLGCDGDDAVDGTSGTDDGESSTDSDSDAAPRKDPCENPITLTDEDGNLLIIADAAQNYSFRSTLSAETVSVRSSSDLVFDWSAVTADMLDIMA